MTYFSELFLKPLMKTIPMICHDTGSEYISSVYGCLFILHKMVNFDLSQIEYDDYFCQLFNVCHAWAFLPLLKMLYFNKMIFRCPRKAI